MSRLWIFSDLHQDWADNAWDPTARAPTFDVAVVAGDVHSPLTKAIDWLGDRLAGAPVIYVPGNHDFWWDGGDDRYTLADQISRGRDLAARRGVHLLIDDTVTLGGVRFLGATLWTDLRLGTGRRRTPHARRARWMNDYRRIRRRSSGKHKYVRPSDTLGAASGEPSVARRPARAAARRADGRRDASCAASVFAADAGVRPRTLLSRAICPLIEAGQPELWVHGHVHNRVDYRIGATRIVCNPRGHVEESSSRTFDPSIVIQVQP